MTVLVASHHSHSAGIMPFFLNRQKIIKQEKKMNTIQSMEEGLN